ncbi:SNF2 family N-terminal domain-containing protein [Tricladium varicosporioides]|nr:SNF2 family N-terminal domain-containing protein [Hymenoscyphus varicosporioides]
MAFNFSANGLQVPDSPAVKRQKTASGYNSTSASPADTETYNSENDSGDELFAGYIPDTPKHGYETQPTQIIDRTAQIAPHSPTTPKTVVQVPASSPFSGRDSDTPTQKSSYFNPSAPPYKGLPPHSLLAASMAPAGTAYRPPHGIVNRPLPAKPPPARGVIDLVGSDEDDGPKFLGGSSDSDNGARSRGDIIPSYFAPRSAETSFGSASNSGNAKFQSVLKNAAYQPKPQAQTRPDRARPVEDIDLDMTASQKMRENIVRVRKVIPVGVLAAQNALIKCKGNLDDAINLLAGKDDCEIISETITLSDDDAEIPELPSKLENQMKRGLTGPSVSIRDKYSSTQALPARKPTQETPPKPKRKLMKGRKHPSSPAIPIVSSPLKLPPRPSPAASVHDDFGSDDSGVASESEEDPELEGRVLKYLNSCSADDLVELTNITKEIAEMMLGPRPFKNLDAARTVENTKTLKSGKKSARAPIGNKIVDTALEMFVGYEAIDVLVSRCESLGKPLAEEMGKWGFDVFGASKDGELEFTSLEDDVDSLRDSGIGSPSSGNASPRNADDDIRPATIPRKRSLVTFLKKPDIMAEDTVLKDYQVVGLNWLALMYRHKLSCILADEMGLGKTCQVIAFLSHLVETGNSGPHLVVCPGSTLENWLRECNRFAPQLMVEPYHGLQKERAEMAETILENRSQINVVVTTYDMAAKKEDNKFMRRLKPDVVCYDEGHLLKNVNSQRYQGLIKIPAKFRLLLTGTPLQNNLQELAALLAFILPEVFQERADDLNYIFKAKASTRDADHAALLSAQRIARARSMLTPFILKRKKAQVLKHLPTKTCRVEYTTLHPSQKKIYDGHLDQARERARLRVEGGKIPKNDENNPLMQLRKAAIHPLLFRRHFTDEKIEKMADILRKKDPVNFPTDRDHRREHLVEEMRAGSDYWLHQWCLDYPCIRSYDIKDLAWMDSGKVESMVKLVKEYKENGDRVLIFSQFALVLDILEAVLNTSLISYTRIDGSTKIDERQSLIDTFRDDETITAFLLTTKAGGTGINLMYANKVIIFDGSFNPQDDRQAENRAHRVGQTRDVEVVRLVTKNTVEEQIYALGESKLALDGRVAGDDDTAMAEAGEKAVSKMLLEGTTSTASKEGEEKSAPKGDVDKDDNTPKRKGKGREKPLPSRKKTTILDMVTNRKVVDLDDEK